MTYDLSFRCELDTAIEEQHYLQLMRKQSKSTSKLVHDSYRSAIDEECSSARSSGILKSQTELKMNINTQIQRQKIETLSDIIESSNECSSRTNFEDRNNKLTFLMNQIPE